MALSSGTLMRLVFPFIPLMGPLGYLVSFLHLSPARIKLTSSNLQAVNIAGVLLIALFLIHENPIFLRTFGLLCGASIAALCIKYSDTCSLHSLLKTFFWLNVFFIMLEVSAYQFGLDILGSKGRFGGLLGYDFVPFIMCTFIVYVARNNQNLKVLDGISIIFAVVATLLSGRFGIPILGITAIYILLQLRDFTVVASVVIFAAFLFIAFENQLNFTFATIAVLIESPQAQDTDFSALASYGGEGYYNASPLTWLHEFFSVFNSYTTIFFPSRQSVIVDSGPAFLVANGSIFLMLFYYITTVFLLRPSDQRRGFILCILFITDLKFRCLLSALPTLWLLVIFEVFRRESGRRAIINMKGASNDAINFQSYSKGV